MRCFEKFNFDKHELCIERYLEILKAIITNYYKSIFHRFWSLSEWDRQSYYISGLISRESPKTRKSDLNYYLDNDAKKVLVCQKFLINVLQISQRRIQTIQTRDAKSPALSKSKIKYRIFSIIVKKNEEKIHIFYY
jgi:hypothetical protein